MLQPWAIGSLDSWNQCLFWSKFGMQGALMVYFQDGAGVSGTCRTASRSCTLGMALGCNLVLLWYVWLRPSSSYFLLLTVVALLCILERHHVFQSCYMNTMKHLTFKENDRAGQFGLEFAGGFQMFFYVITYPALANKISRYSVWI